MWKKLKPQIKKWQGLLIIAPSIAGAVIAGSTVGLFNLLEWSVRDQFFRLRPVEPIENRIVIVTMDEADIKYVQQWPMPDRVLAQVLRNISSQQPRGIAIDIYRDLPVEPGHQELVEVFNSTPNLMGIEKVSAPPIAPPPELAKLGQVIANDLILDADGKVRRSLILVGNREGFGVKLAMMYLEKEGIELRVVDEKKKIYGLGKAVFIPLTGNEAEYKKADTRGYQILLNYRGGLKSFPHISLTDVIENRIPPDLMRDRLVFVGAIAPSLNDNFQSPYSSSLKGTKELTPGVVIHANLASQILSAALDDRPMLNASTKPLNWLMILIWSGVSTALGLLYVQKRWVSLGGILLAVVIIISSGYVAFVSGWLIPVFTPMLAVISAAVISIGATLWNNLKLSYQQVQEYAHTLEEKNEELRIAEENYRSIFENALEGIFQAKPDGKYLSVNPALARTYGYESPAEMIANVTNIATQIYVESDRVNEFLLLMQEQGKVKNFEYQAYRHDGSTIWIEENARSVRDNNGNLLYYEGIVQDITQRKKHEEEMKRQLQELRIEIDQQKRKEEVAEVIQSDYFMELQAEAESFRFDDDDF